MHVPLPSEAVQSGATADAAAVIKAREHRPTWDDYRAELGSAATIVKNENGTVEMRTDVRDEAVKARVSAMNEEWRTAELEVGSAMCARIPTTTLLDRNTGRELVLPASSDTERKAKRDGLVEKSNVGRFVVPVKAIYRQRYEVVCRICQKKDVVWRSDEEGTTNVRCTSCKSKEVELR